MSKKVDDSELQTLTLSPTNTNEDESSPFINPASDETAFPISPPPSYSSVTTSSSTLTGEKRKLERMASAPSGSCNKPIPALRVSTPPGSARITYTNERTNDRKMDLSKIIRERPTPSASIGQKKDVADVRQIEQGLLQLMEDFQAGSLRAFGKDSRLKQMEAIREQQERLARLHFDVGAEQDLYPPLSEDGLRASHNNMRTLMERLAQLSESIERLHTNTSSSERKSAPSHLFAQWSTTDSPSTSKAHHHHHHHGRHHHGHHHGHHHHHHHHSSHNTPSNVTESLSSSQQTTPTNTHNVTGNSPAPAASASHHHHSSPGSSRLSQTQPQVPLRLKATNASHFVGLSKAGKVGES